MHVRRFLTTLLLTMLILAVAAPVSAAIRFDKLHYDAPGKDTRNNAQLNKEFVVLTNTGDEPCDGAYS